MLRDRREPIPAPASTTRARLPRPGVGKPAPRKARLKTGRSPSSRVPWLCYSDRGRLDSKHSQIQIELAAVVDLVLLHVVENPVHRVGPFAAVGEAPEDHPA